MRESNETFWHGGYICHARFSKLRFRAMHEFMHENGGMYSWPEREQS
jgi:hypothetical protein